MTEWKDFESSSPWAKLRLLCESLNVPFDRAQEPWSTAKWLCGFRNKAAHAKPEDLFESKLVPNQALQEEMEKWPRSSLERDITLGNASRALDAVQQIKLLLFNAMPEEMRSNIYADSAMFTGSASEG